MLQFTVDLHRFRQALASVKPHVSTDKDDAIGRSVDCSIRPNRELLLTATNGLTVALARVPIAEEDFYGELGRFSLTPEIAGTIIDMFTLGKDDWDIQAEITVTFTTEKQPGAEPDITVATIKVRRLGQLFGGDQLSVTTPLQVRKNIEQIWATVGRSASRTHAMLPPTRFDLKRITVFRSAQTTYGEPLTVTAMSHGLGNITVYCGRYFVGLLTADTVNLDDRDKENFDNLKEHWAKELPTPLAVVS